MKARLTAAIAVVTMLAASVGLSGSQVTEPASTDADLSPAKSDADDDSLRRRARLLYGSARCWPLLHEAAGTAAPSSLGLHLDLHLRGQATPVTDKPAAASGLPSTVGTAATGQDCASSE